MPVEIRELYIKTVIGNEPQGSGGAPRRPSGGDPQQEQERLIALCVERVMELLRLQQER